MDSISSVSNLQISNDLLPYKPLKRKTIVTTGEDYISSLIRRKCTLVVTCKTNFKAEEEENKHLTRRGSYPLTNSVLEQRNINWLSGRQPTV